MNKNHCKEFIKPRRQGWFSSKQESHQKRRIESKNAKEEGRTRCSAHTSELIRFKSPEGTRRIGPPFPIKSLIRFQQSMDKINSNERNRGRGTQGRRPGKQRIHGHNTKAASNLTQVKGYLYPRDRSDRYAGPVRPVR